MGVLDHWVRDLEMYQERLPEAGIGMFDHWFENQEPKLPEAGIGIFDHWFEGEETVKMEGNDD